MQKQFMYVCLLACISLTMIWAVTVKAFKISSQGEVVVSVFQFPEDLQKAPVKVVRVDAQGRGLELGKPQALSGKWLDDFNVTVESTTDKTIHYIEMRLELVSSKGEIPIIPISTGRESVHAPDYPGLVERDIYFSPDARATLSGKSICASVYDIMKEKNLSMADVNEAILRVDIVIFDDDTGWAQGYPIKRDPANRNAWVRSDLRVEELGLKKGNRSNPTPNSTPGFLKIGATRQPLCYVYEGHERVACPNGKFCTANVEKHRAERNKYFLNNWTYLCSGGSGCTYYSGKQISYAYACSG